MRGVVSHTGEVGPSVMMRPASFPVSLTGRRSLTSSWAAQEILPTSFLLTEINLLGAWKHLFKSLHIWFSFLYYSNSHYISELCKFSVLVSIQCRSHSLIDSFSLIVYMLVWVSGCLSLNVLLVVNVLELLWVSHTFSILWIQHYLIKLNGQ